MELFDLALKQTTTSLCLLLAQGHRALPPRWKDVYAGAIWSVLFPTLRVMLPLQKLALRTGNIQEALSEYMPGDAQASLDVPGAENEDVSILFSGGGDSTLAAYLLSRRFRRVHLLTCQHMGIKEPWKPLKNATNLQRVCGAEKFVHRLLDVRQTFVSVYEAEREPLIEQHGLLADLLCGPCKLSMHSAQIAYNRKHGIRYAASGANMEGGGVFVEQMMRARREVLEPLFDSYGQKLLAPVYYQSRSDRKLYELGITVLPETKFPRDNTHYQTWCNFSVLHNIYARGHFLQLRSPAELEDASVAIAQAKVPRIRQLIDEMSPDGPHVLAY